MRSFKRPKRYLAARRIGAGRPSFRTARANSWKRPFLRHFRREVSRIRPGTANDLARRTASAAQRLFDESEKGAPDKSALVVIGASSLALAGYRELLAEGIDRNTAYEAVRRAFLATYRMPTRLFTRLFLLLSRDPVASLSGGSMLKLNRRMFGVGFEFDQRISADGYDLIVTRCLFNQFFVDHGEPLLTRIACEWDRSWMDEMNSSKRPIRVERPLTIATGCERCEFQHMRTTNRAGAPVDVCVEGRAEVVEALTPPTGS